MWEWIFTELIKAGKRIMKSPNNDGIELDDVVQEVCLRLIENQDFAEEIYNSQNIGILTKLLKLQMYEQRSNNFFDNKTDFMRYQKILKVCERYCIEPIPQNAYKISEILNDNSYSISLVESILAKKKVLNYRHFEGN